MIETVENDIEELTISHKSLPPVQPDRREARPAFAQEKSDSFEDGIECGEVREVWDIPGPSSATPRYRSD